MKDYHWNINGLPPISSRIWLLVKTAQGEVLKVKRTSIIDNKDIWDWPVVDIKGNEFTVNVVGWAYY